ncbi:MAG TPA: hypothetical protein ENJ48_02345, partial [Anaerolineae bacterium]|nr:hypothetical protein [Anaerolineae bacterium]
MFPMLLLAIALTSFAPPTPAAATKIDAYVQAIFRTEDTAEFLVILAPRADLSAAARLPSKMEKGRAVRDALWHTAQTSQAGLRVWLDARGVSYRPFYIVNAILVTGNESLAQAIAVRPEVARLVANPRIKNDMP